MSNRTAECCLSARPGLSYLQLTPNRIPTICLSLQGMHPRGFLDSPKRLSIQTRNKTDIWLSCAFPLIPQKFLKVMYSRSNNTPCMLLASLLASLLAALLVALLAALPTRAACADSGTKQNFQIHDSISDLVYFARIWKMDFLCLGKCRLDEVNDQTDPFGGGRCCTITTRRAIH